MKTCGRCGASLPLTEYRRDAGKRDGLRGECNACANAYSKAGYHRRKSGLRAIRRPQHPKRRAVTIAFSNALRDGKVKPQPCWVCGERAHGHHPDYDRPLDVVWLCPAHHAQTHALMESVYVHVC